MIRSAVSLALLAVLPTLVAGASLELTASAGQTKELVYYIWDTGDGRWIPSARGKADAVAVAKTDVLWQSTGTCTTRWQAVSLSGRIFQGLETAVCVKDSNAETNALLLASAAGKNFSSPEKYKSDTIEIPLKGLRAVEWVVLHGANDGLFPADFSVEISHDGGARWRRVMSAEFVFFPNPGTNAVWIPLRGVAADAVRIFVPRGNALDGGQCGWSLGKTEVYGKANFPWTLEGGSAAETAAWNNLWLNFGIAANEVHERFDPWWTTERPLDGGMVCIGSCIWLYWDAIKLSWLGSGPDVKRLESCINENPVGPDGYAWASPGHEKHLDHSRHYSTGAAYIRGTAYHYLMQRDPAFLAMKDPATDETVLSKARRTMQFQLSNLHGADGLLVFDDPKHDGTANSLGGNYWDFWLFGYKSAYDNAVFYDSLYWMAELEQSLGNEKRAQELRDLRPLVKNRFNETFWNPETGRYIGWQDINGKRNDYGFTDVNLMALAFDLADAEKAESVLSWLDGTRQVENDDAHDVYAFGFAPRSTTVDALRGNPQVVNTWGGELNIAPGESASFGRQIQNGGAIFFCSYHDLQARRHYRGAEDVYRRWQGILAEFSKDELRRDPDNFRGQSDKFGILREFPESGLVPYFFVDGVLGLSPQADGLRIEPCLPSAWKAARIESFHFAGKDLRIRTDRAVKLPAIDPDETILVPAEGVFLFTPDGRLQVFGENP